MQRDVRLLVCSAVAAKCFSVEMIPATQGTTDFLPRSAASCLCRKAKARWQ